MKTIYADNVNEALYLGVMMMKEHTHNVRRVSPRGMETIEWREPVSTTYRYPCERVLFNKERDANPFFHFFEGLWMLAGRADVGFLAQFNKRMKDFSDDGVTFHAAYGFRMRRQFGMDQLAAVIRELKHDPDSRRAVVQIWNAPTDLGTISKDIPCNDLIFFKVREGYLHMTVCCRSNDMLWGVYGANAVHFSMIMEYVADKIGASVGQYTQVSDSFHVYLDGPGGELWNKMCEAHDLIENPYDTQEVRVYRMEADHPGWDEDLQAFFFYYDQGRDDLCCLGGNYHTPFFKEVVCPMYAAFHSRHTADVEEIEASDWRRACREWLLRRTSK